MLDLPTGEFFVISQRTSKDWGHLHYNYLRPPGTARAIVHNKVLIIFARHGYQFHTHSIVEDAGYFVKETPVYQQKELKMEILRLRLRMTFKKQVLSFLFQVWQDQE